MVRNFEFGTPPFTRKWTPNRQGLPCFLGSSPARSSTELVGADVAILGVPYAAPDVGEGNDQAPRNIRLAGLLYEGTYLPEFDVDPAKALRIVDYGDVDVSTENTKVTMAAVERAVGEIIDAGCLPVTIGGTAPCASYPVGLVLGSRGMGPMGLISFDGHTDSMPGDASPNASNWVRLMYETSDLLSSENHIQIGVRGPNNPHEHIMFCRQMGIRLVWGSEAAKMGSERLAAEAVRVAGSETKGIWLAVDYDVADRSAVPDWDYPDPLGVSAQDILTCAYECGRTAKLKAISLMMINGNRQSVVRLALWTILYALAGVVAARS